MCIFQAEMESLAEKSKSRSKEYPDKKKKAEVSRDST